MTEVRRHSKACAICETQFMAYRSNAMYCSDPCKQKAERARRPRNPDYHRAYGLQKHYGITTDQYAELLQKQNGGCAICGKTPEQEKRNLAVDHDHKTGEIFGLLCWFCNHRLIGKVRDPSAFERAAEYLKQGTGLLVPPKKRKKRKPRNGKVKTRAI